jgi:two-component system, LuxR family, response regulator FixJ
VPQAPGKIDPRLAGSPSLWREAKAKVAKLAPREIQVLTLLVQGLSNKEIGEALEISSRTVEIYRKNVMVKLDAKIAADAVRIAIYAALAESIGAIPA